MEKDYKKEIEFLINSKNELENKISKALGQKDLMITQLKEEFDITENEIDDKVKEYESSIEEIKKEMEKLISQLSEYVKKLEVILNG